MRLIPWNDKLVEDTLAFYAQCDKGYANTFQRNLCCAAESLVEAYYNKPIHLELKTDDGYDFILNDAKIDVKAHVNNVRCFEWTTNSWAVASYNGLSADFYLFTEIDYKNKQIALIGYLSKADILKCRHVAKGEFVRNFRATSSCYIVEYNDLNLIF